MVEELEKKLQEKLGDALEGKLEAKIEEFGGLLTRRAAIYLLCKESGIDTEKKLFLSEASSSSLPFSFTAIVERIFPLQSYASSPDKSVRLHVSDKTGSATLLLWNEQAEQVEGGISAGDTVECRNAYFRGGEIGIGRTGSIKAVVRSPVSSVSKLTQGVCSVEGEVGEVEPDLEYLDKKTGEARKMSSFQLCEEGGRQCRRVVVWSYQQGAEKPEEGDILFLENVLFRNGELHFNSYSRMVKKKSSSLHTGKLEGLRMDGDGAVFSIDGRKYSLPLSDALSLIGIKSLPEGVAAQTLLSIKSGGMEGKTVNYRVSLGKLSFLSVVQEKKRES